ncbi:glycosyltransferase family 9 protein [Thiohalomonas denitrificans]|uniref:glycosyltransferase family 9 protein n=1 Tax=Thiohalomonas denitrificans TaxID=415747 RepID=UPI0026EEBE01|nr:glycosyltransferase family 9 protein [Thiohalomonas denitrificans]
MTRTRILVVRNDKLGDFMLAWPAFRLLKEQLPDARVLALVPEYTRCMAELCPWIDEVVLDPGGSQYRDIRQISRQIRQSGANRAILLFSTARVVTALAFAGVRYRLGPATKLAQILLTDRVVQRRSRSEKPEFEYNADLVRHFLRRDAKAIPATPNGPFLEFPAAELKTFGAELSKRLDLPADAQWLFVHAGSGGSANNLRPEQYQDLCHRLAKTGRAFVFTAGPGEEPVARDLVSSLRGVAPAAVLPPEALPSLARHLALADCFISGSTGPLHIAGALNRPTATFYPGHRSGSPLRWQTLNDADVRLTFSPPGEGDPKDVSRCHIADAAEQIDALLSRIRRQDEVF